MDWSITGWNALLGRDGTAAATAPAMPPSPPLSAGPKSKTGGRTLTSLGSRVRSQSLSLKPPTNLRHGSPRLRTRSETTSVTFLDPTLHTRVHIYDQDPNLPLVAKKDRRKVKQKFDGSGIHMRRKLKEERKRTRSISESSHTSGDSSGDSSSSCSGASDSSASAASSASSTTSPVRHVDSRIQPTPPPSPSPRGHRTAPSFRPSVGPPVRAINDSYLHDSSITSTGGTGADDGGNMLDVPQQQAKANPPTDPAQSMLATAGANDAMFYQAVLLAIAAVSLAAVWSL